MAGNLTIRVGKVSAIIFDKQGGRIKSSGDWGFGENSFVCKNGAGVSFTANQLLWEGMDPNNEHNLKIYSKENITLTSTGDWEFLNVILEGKYNGPPVTSINILFFPSIAGSPEFSVEIIFFP